MSFTDGATERAFNGIARKRFPSELLQVSRRKLRVLRRATTLEDLRYPFGNGLEALTGDRRGQHSIRVNDQFRICFVWREGNAYEVEFTDYH